MYFKDLERLKDEYYQPDISDKLQQSPSVSFWQVGSDVLAVSERPDLSMYNECK